MPAPAQPSIVAGNPSQLFRRNADGLTTSPVVWSYTVKADGSAAPSFANDDQGYVVAAGRTPRVTASMVRPGQATAYADADIIGNSQTANLVVPLSFDIGRRSGRLTGCRAVVEAAAGALITTLLDFDLYVFRSEANMPVAAGAFPADNSPLVLTAAAMKQMVGLFSFSSASWNTRGQATSGYQSVPLNSTRPYAPFNIEGLADTTLKAVVMARAAWNPGNVAQTFDFILDVDAD